MKGSKRRRPSVAINTVPLPEKVLHMPVKKGKVSKLRGKYFFTVGRKKMEIPIGPIISKADVNQLVGKEVYAAFSNRKKSEIVAIGTWPTPERPAIRPFWILCYLPAPDMIRRVDVQVRETLLKNMLSQRIITPKLASQIKIGIKKSM
jgi:hypothetical protein